MEYSAYEDKTVVGKFIARQGRLEDLRNPYDSRFSEIIDFCEPGLTAWSGHHDGEGVGDFRGEKIYEGTPPWALRTMAKGWLGNLVSRSLRWLKYVLPDKELRDNDQVNQFLQDTEDHMISVYRRSELYAALNPYTRAALSVGSPVIIPYEHDHRIKMMVPHPAENYHGPMDTYHRKYQLTAMEAVEEFMGGRVPQESDGRDQKLSFALLQAWRSGDHTAKFTFLRCFCRREDPILRDAPRRYRRAPWMEFALEYNNADDALQQREPLTVQPHWTRPHIRWDYERNANEFYARTPAWNAMQDIRSGQEMAKQMIEAGQEALKPPLWLYGKLRSRYHLRPGGRTYYTNAEEAALEPRVVQTTKAYPHGVDVHERIKQSVERWFVIDLWRMMSRLRDRETGGWPTATHVMEMASEKAALLAPEIGDFTDAVAEIDDRCYGIEYMAGRAPALPDILQEYMAESRALDPTYDGKVIDIHFIGPLAMMQQRGMTLGRTQAGLAILGQYTALEPNIVHKVNLPKAAERDLEGVGFYQDCIRTEDEYNEIVTALAQREAAAAVGENLRETAKVLPSLGRAVEEGSPLNRMMEGAPA